MLTNLWNLSWVNEYNFHNFRSHFRPMNIDSQLYLKWRETFLQSPVPVYQLRGCFLEDLI